MVANHAYCTFHKYSNYLAMHRVQTHAGAISKLLFGFAFVQLKLMDYLPVHTQEQYTITSDCRFLVTWAYCLEGNIF